MILTTTALANHAFFVSDLLEKTFATILRVVFLKKIDKISVIHMASNSTQMVD